MQRVTQRTLSILLLITSAGYTQSLADAARENRKQQSNKKTASPTKVITSDDVSASADPILHLVPGSSSSGGGTLVAPGMWKHNYRVVRLDASRFANGGTLHIAITLGNGKSDASFDLYPGGAPLPTDGFPRSLAYAHDVLQTTTGKIDYHFQQGTVFLLGAEGSWHAKTGDTNTYSFVVNVDNK